jgi:hypothetical protein
MFTWIAAEEFSISSLNFSSVGGFPISFRDLHK